MKKILFITFLAVFQANACEEDCVQKPSPINCGEAMHSYSENIETYAEAVEKINISELEKFRVWLEENETIQITCGAYNQDKTLEPHYREILLANVQLVSSIRGLIRSNEIFSKPDEAFTDDVKEGYLQMRNSTKVFNKAFQHRTLRVLDSL